MPYSCIDITDLENQLAIYEYELSGLQDDLADLQSDLSAAESLLNQYKSNLENQKNLLFEKQIELATVQRELQKLRNELAFLELRLAELEREKADIQAYIQSQPEIKSLWCADYTLDLSGQVGIADVPGEMNAMQIRQGYSGRAVYNSTRDGILQHAKASTPANTFLQACLMPAVRKFKPQYRHGTITAIDYDNDTCSISLTEATSQYMFDVFDINQTYELHNIPIEYMQCNAAVFVIGDKVLIEYPDRKTPKVVGFYENPKACSLEQYIVISIVESTIAFAFGEDGSDPLPFWVIVFDPVTRAVAEIPKTGGGFLTMPCLLSDTDFQAWYATTKNVSSSNCYGSWVIAADNMPTIISEPYIQLSSNTGCGDLYLESSPDLSETVINGIQDDLYSIWATTRHGGYQYSPAIYSELPATYVDTGSYNIPIITQAGGTTCFRTAKEKYVSNVYKECGYPLFDSDGNEKGDPDYILEEFEMLVSSTITNYTFHTPIGDMGMLNVGTIRRSSTFNHVLSWCKVDPLYYGVNQYFPKYNLPEWVDEFTNENVMPQGPTCGSCTIQCDYVEHGGVQTRHQNYDLTKIYAKYTNTLMIQVYAIQWRTAKKLWDLGDISAKKSYNNFYEPVHLAACCEIFESAIAEDPGAQYRQVDFETVIMDLFTASGYKSGDYTLDGGMPAMINSLNIEIRGL